MEWKTRTVKQRGLELPYKRQDSNTGYHKKAVESGTVFISEDVLMSIAKRTEDDYLWDAVPFQIGKLEGLALEQAQLAVREPRNGFHGTDKLRRFVGLLEPNRGGIMHSGAHQGKGVIRA